MTNFIWPSSSQVLRDTTVYPDTFEPIDESRTSSLGFNVDHHDITFIRELNARIAALMEQRAVYMYSLFRKLHPASAVPQFAWPQSASQMVRTDLEPDTFAPISDISHTGLGLNLHDPLAAKIFETSQIIVDVWNQRNHILEAAIEQYAQTRVNAAQMDIPLDKLYAPAGEKVSMPAAVSSASVLVNTQGSGHQVPKQTQTVHQQGMPIVPLAQPIQPDTQATQPVQSAPLVQQVQSAKPVQLNQPVIAVQKPASAVPAQTVPAQTVPIQTVPVQAVPMQMVQPVVDAPTPEPAQYAQAGQNAASQPQVQSQVQPHIHSQFHPQLQPQFTAQQESTHLSMQNLILYAGVSLIGLAAIAFASAAFSIMNHTARSITLGAFSIIFMMVAYGLRKRLHITAEGVTWLAFAIAVVDVVYMSANGVLPHTDSQYFTAIPLAVIAGLGWAVEKISNRGMTSEGKSAQLDAGRWVRVVLLAPIVFFLPFMLPLTRQVHIYFGLVLVSLLVGLTHMGPKKFTVHKRIWFIFSFIALIFLTIIGIGFGITDFPAADFITPCVALVYWFASQLMPRAGRATSSIKPLGGAVDLFSLIAFVLPYILRTFGHASLEYMDWYILLGACAAYGLFMLDRKVVKDGELEYRARTFTSLYAVILTVLMGIRVIAVVFVYEHNAYAAYDMHALTCAVMAAIPSLMWALDAYMGSKTEHIAVIGITASVYIAAYGTRPNVFMFIAIALAAAFICAGVLTRKSYARVFSREAGLSHFMKLNITGRIITLIATCIAYGSYIDNAEHVHWKYAVPMSDKASILIAGILLVCVIIGARIVLSQGLPKIIAMFLTVAAYPAIAYIISVADRLTTHSAYFGLVMVMCVFIAALYSASLVKPADQKSKLAYRFDRMECVVVMVIATIDFIRLVTHHAQLLQFAGLVYTVFFIATVAYWVSERAHKDILQADIRAQSIPYVAVGSVTLIAVVAAMMRWQPYDFPDTYTLSAGALLTMCGVYNLMWKPQLRTATALAAGFVVLLAPGFILSSVHAPLQPLRDILMILMLAGFAAWGGLMKWRAPLLTGTIGIVTFALMRTWVIVSRFATQYWFLTLFVAGAGLILLAAFFESVKTWAVKLWQMR